MSDKMNRLEKVALTSAVSGAVFNVFLYGIGATLSTATTAPLLYVRVVAAILQAAAFDLVAIATVMGMRTGRRGHWSMATAVASALVSAAIALDVAGVWPQPWLHAANALIVLAFTLHLLTPRRSSRAAQLRRLVRRLVASVRQARQVIEQSMTDRDMAAAAHEQQMASLQAELAATRQAYEQAAAEHGSVLASREQQMASLRTELATTRQALNSQPAPMTIDVIRVARCELTWEQMKALADMIRQSNGASLSTIRRLVAEVATPLTDGEV